MKTKKIMSVLFMSAIVLAIAVLVAAQSQQELEQEKAQLESELIEQGYGCGNENLKRRVSINMDLSL